MLNSITIIYVRMIDLNNKQKELNLKFSKKYGLN